MSRPPRIMLRALVVATLAVMACGSSGTDESGSSSGAATESAGDAGTDEVSAELTSGELAQQGEPVDAARRIVYTATLRLRVEDPRAGAAEVVDIAEAAAGSLDSQDEDDEDQVRVTVRAPSDRFDEVLDEFATLGTVLDRTVDTGGDRSAAPPPASPSVPQAETGPASPSGA